MKRYTEEELKKIISKKYHSMIDWQATMRFGFDGWVELVDNGQATTSLAPSLYEQVRNINWYLREIQKNPEVQW